GLGVYPDRDLVLVALADLTDTRTGQRPVPAVLGPVMPGDQVGEAPVQPGRGVRAGHLIPLPPRERHKKRLRSHVVGQAPAQPPRGITMDLGVVAIEDGGETLRLTPRLPDDLGVADLLRRQRRHHRGHVWVIRIIVCLPKEGAYPFFADPPRTVRPPRPGRGNGSQHVVDPSHDPRSGVRAELTECRFSCCARPEPGRPGAGRWPGSGRRRCTGWP